MPIVERLIITKGSDRAPLLRLKSRKSSDPMDLTEATNIQVYFPKRDRSQLVLSNAIIPATKAQAIKQTLTFTAVDYGAKGNNIVLQFNGVDTVEQVCASWNLANPTNPVAHNSATGDEVFATSVLRLTNGYNEYQQVEVYGDPRLGKLMLRLLDKDTEQLKSGPNQSFKVVVDFGVHPGGTRHVGYYENKLEVIGD